jgi:hypothetical protein
MPIDSIHPICCSRHTFKLLNSRIDYRSIYRVYILISPPRVRSYTFSQSRARLLNLGNAPVDIQYMDRMWQRKDDESRSLDGLGKMGGVDRPKTL